jgi:hypothetical protein
METILIHNAAGRTRRVKEKGREYIVAPLSLIVSGVLNGSKGALYYPEDEIANSADIWNGIPLVVYHPTQNGKPVSAKSPGIWEKSGIGRVRNSRYKGKLIAEGWFDVERMKRIDPRVYDSLVKNKPIELSTGLFTNNEPARNGATCPKGRPYQYIARSYRADHVAVLPDQVGACSLNDGCGVLVNQVSEMTWNSFNPSQPRDEDGQWATIKGGGKHKGSSPPEKSAAPTPVRVPPKAKSFVARLGPKALAVLDKASELLSSKEFHYTSFGMVLGSGLNSPVGMIALTTSALASLYKDARDNRKREFRHDQTGPLNNASIEEEAKELLKLIIEGLKEEKQWEPLENAEGENCGTGAGGFQPGNDCSKGKKNYRADKSDIQKLTQAAEDNPDDPLVYDALRDAYEEKGDQQGIVRASLAKTLSERPHFERAAAILETPGVDPLLFVISGPRTNTGEYFGAVHEVLQNPNYQKLFHLETVRLHRGGKPNYLKTVDKFFELLSRYGDLKDFRYGRTTSGETTVNTFNHSQKRGDKDWEPLDNQDLRSGDYDKINKKSLRKKSHLKFMSKILPARAGSAFSYQVGNAEREYIRDDDGKFARHPGVASKPAGRTPSGHGGAAGRGNVYAHDREYGRVTGQVRLCRGSGRVSEVGTRTPKNTPTPLLSFPNLRRKGI